MDVAVCAPRHCTAQYYTVQLKVQVEVWVLKSTGAFRLWNIGNHSDNVVPKGAVILSTPTDCGGEIHKVGLQCRNTAKPCSTEFCVLVGEVQRPRGSKMKNDNYENCGKLLNGTFTPGSEIIPPHTQDVQCQAVHQ